MPTEIWCEIVCAKCATANIGQYATGRIPRKELKAQARSAGWLFDGDEAFCSAECKDEWNHESTGEPTL
jgi:hypothetical protein